MSWLRPLTAELRKLLTLPATGLAVILTLTIAPGFTAMSAAWLRAAIDRAPVGTDPSTITVGTITPATIGLGELLMGAVAATVIGVVAMSSEYTRAPASRGGGRQLQTTLVATPRRGPLLVAKVAAVIIVVTALAIVAVSATTAVARSALGGVATVPNAEPVARYGSAVLAWNANALIALGLTWWTRSGLIPLVVLLINSSVVSVGQLVSHFSTVGHYLPDSAAVALVRAVEDPTLPRPAVAAGILLAWSAALLGSGALAMIRRDA